MADDIKTFLCNKHNIEPDEICEVSFTTGFCTHDSKCTGADEYEFVTFFEKVLGLHMSHSCHGYLVKDQVHPPILKNLSKDEACMVRDYIHSPPKLIICSERPLWEVYRDSTKKQIQRNLNFAWSNTCDNWNFCEVPTELADHVLKELKDWKQFMDRWEIKHMYCQAVQLTEKFQYESDDSNDDL